QHRLDLVEKGRKFSEMEKTTSVVPGKISYYNKQIRFISKQLPRITKRIQQTKLKEEKEILLKKFNYQKNRLEVFQQRMDFLCVLRNLSLAIDNATLAIHQLRNKTRNLDVDVELEIALCIIAGKLPNAIKIMKCVRRRLERNIFLLQDPVQLKLVYIMFASLACNPDFLPHLPLSVLKSSNESVESSDDDVTFLKKTKSDTKKKYKNEKWKELYQAKVSKDVYAKLTVNPTTKKEYIDIRKYEDDIPLKKGISSANSAGVDLYSAHDYIIRAKGKALIKTDIQLLFPPGCYGRIAPRSGLAFNHFIDVGCSLMLV
ncbi:dUTP pyrophosphatase-like protein, partial [Dinothrombium tinctorium]